jgi:hypothetical protein
MIAAPDHPRWGKTKTGRARGATLSQLAQEVVCVVAGDRTLIDQLPEPEAGGSRVMVETESSIAALVRANVGVGFVLCFDEHRSSHFREDLGLYTYEVEEVAPRTLAAWKRVGEAWPEAVEYFFTKLKEKLSR